MAFKIEALILFGLVSPSVCLLPNSPRADSEHATMTYAILQRFYIINRLERTCTRLFSMTFPPHTTLDALQSILPLLQHERVRATITLMHTQGSLEPLNKLWKAICIYRFLDDQLLIEEFTRMVYTLLIQHKTKTASSSETGIAADPAPAKQHYWFTTLPDAQAITQRFYLIQRLQYAIAVCKEKYRLSKDPAFVVMLSLWDDLCQYKHIENLTFSFGICSSIIALLEDKHVQLTEKPLEQLLEYIDGLADGYHYLP